MGMDIRLYIEHKEVTPWREVKWKEFVDSKDILDWGVLETRKSQVQDPLFTGIKGLPKLNDNAHTLPSNKVKNAHHEELLELGHYYTYFTPQEYIDYYEKHKDILDSNSTYIEFGKERNRCYLIKSFVQELKKLSEYDSLDNFRIIYFMG